MVLNGNKRETVRQQVEDITYYLTYKPVRRINLRIKVPEGKVMVSAPLTVSLATVEEFVRKNRDWIHQQMEKLNLTGIRQERRYVTGETYYVWGRKYELVVVEMEPDLFAGMEEPLPAASGTAASTTAVLVEDDSDRVIQGTLFAEDPLFREQEESDMAGANGLFAEGEEMDGSLPMGRLRSIFDPDNYGPQDGLLVCSDGQQSLFGSCAGAGAAAGGERSGGVTGGFGTAGKDRTGDSSAAGPATGRAGGRRGGDALLLWDAADERTERQVAGPSEGNCCAAADSPSRASREERGGETEAVIRVDRRHITLQCPKGTSVEDRRNYLELWLRERLEAYLPAVFRACGLIVGKEASSWYVRKMTSRWGTCNVRTGRVCINLNLAHFKPEFLTYIVTHELTHLWETGHGERFKERMDMYYPEWRERRKELKTLSYML